MRVYKIPKKRNLLSSLSITNRLIILNVFCWIISLVAIYFYGYENFSNWIALTPNNILHLQGLWTLVTAIFSHVSFWHIFANMFSLFFVGNFLEKIIGRKRFLGTYLISGIIGSFVFILWAWVTGDVMIPGVGASGAIFGLLGVLSLVVPMSKIYLIAGPLIIIIIDAVLGPFLPANIYSVLSPIFTILIFVMFFAIFSWNPRFRKLAIPIELKMWMLPFVAIVPLVIIELILRSRGINFPISNSAHIGGLVGGLAYGIYLKKKYSKKMDNIARMFE